MSRRRLLGAAAGALAAAMPAGCGADRTEGGLLMPQGGGSRRSDGAAVKGRLVARPRPAKEAGKPGLQRLGLGGNRDGLVYVPPAYKPDSPAPLAVMLHGANGEAEYGLAPLRDLADAAGLILLAPESRGRTWDVILGDFGPDVAFLDRALDWAFDRYAVDAGRVAVGGFSDGASYGLSIGVTNGDLFTHVIAFSPGFIAPAGQAGSPRLFISHGTRDQVLPIDACSRRIVPQVQRAGYDVRYEEFDGPHVVPDSIAREALAWFLES
jgi:predicted esterase